MRLYHIRISIHPRSIYSTNNNNTNTNDQSKQSNTSPLTDSNTFTPRTIFQRLPVHKPRPTNRNNALNGYRNADYRFGPIRIDWADLTVSALMNASAGKERERKRGPVTASFVHHKQQQNVSTGSTNLPEGTVHLFRDYQDPEPAILGSDVQSATTRAGNEDAAEDAAVGAVSNATSSPTSTVKTDPEIGGVTLAVLAVPAYMGPSDFLAFAAPAGEGMTHVRIIRDSAPNRSIVVINFRKPSDAEDFIEVYNGRPFNSTEPEICHIVRVASITFESSDSVSAALTKRISSSQESPGSEYELPTCPVCLERMDSAVTGLITVPCAHTFHCMCLSKWGDSRCPVCRYSQTLLSSHSHTTPSSLLSRHPPSSNTSLSSVSTCFSCSSTSNLWICLICGNIGCGRYGRAHAQSHYELTTHLYAMELETQRVWDYAGDGYVHRLIQNRADGKLVELPSAASSAAAAAANPASAGRGDGGQGGPSASDALNAEKIEAIGIEYSYLLTSQLESQRAYYEERTAELVGQVEQLKEVAESLTREVAAERASAAEERALRLRELEARESEIARSKIKSENRAEKATEIARKLGKDLMDEKAVSEGLLRNLKESKERTEVLRQENMVMQAQVKDLEDQLRDVMFFLDAKTKIEDADGGLGEAAGGSISTVSKKKSKR